MQLNIYIYIVPFKKPAKYFIGIKTIKFFVLYFQLDRYESILKKLNLLEETIDYLKMDVEGAEIDFFYDLFKNSPHLIKNIKQIGMEIHPSSTSMLLQKFFL